MNKSTRLPGHSPHRDLSKERFWRQTLRRFAVGGQSIRAFCREHGLAEPSFYAWRRTLVQRDAAAAKATPPAPSTPAFLPIRLTGNASRMEIRLAGGTRIRLRPPVDRTALADVLAALQTLA